MKHILNRRDMLTRCSSGFGLLALQGMLGSQSALAAAQTHFKPKAKSVIFATCREGVRISIPSIPNRPFKKLAGKPMPVKIERTQFNKNGNASFPVLSSLNSMVKVAFQSSSIFPKVGEMIDDLAVIRSMTSKVNEHAQGNYAFHTGFPFMGHPSCWSMGKLRTRFGKRKPTWFRCPQQWGSVAPARRGRPIWKRLFARISPRIDPSGGQTGTRPQRKAQRITPCPTEPARADQGIRSGFPHAVRETTPKSKPQSGIRKPLFACKRPFPSCVTLPGKLKPRKNSTDSIPPISKRLVMPSSACLPEG